MLRFKNAKSFGIKYGYCGGNYDVLFTCHDDWTHMYPLPCLHYNGDKWFPLLRYVPCFVVGTPEWPKLQHIGLTDPSDVIYVRREAVQGGKFPVISLSCVRRLNVLPEPDRLAIIEAAQPRVLHPVELAHQQKVRAKGTLR
ncbi:MAG TPA: hypothetical protein VK968_09565 [Roseimicrobium sp.]|nr:hypothetical protein [Roseimicrobium sp.]